MSFQPFIMPEKGTAMLTNLIRVSQLVKISDQQNYEALAEHLCGGPLEDEDVPTISCSGRREDDIVSEASATMTGD
ncbi:hypothetical protein Tco_1350326 [Tanacetum coccineum]